MKIRFSEIELKYLDINLKILNQYRDRTDVKMARTIVKMLNKFSPNALASFLNASERALLRQVLTFRETDLIEKNSNSEELELVRGLLVKVQK